MSPLSVSTVSQLSGTFGVGAAIAEMVGEAVCLCGVCHAFLGARVFTGTPPRAFESGAAAIDVVVVRVFMHESTCGRDTPRGSVGERSGKVGGVDTGMLDVVAADDRLY